MLNTGAIIEHLNNEDRYYFSYPSSHAALRIRQRTSMLPQELMYLIDKNVYIDITQEFGPYGIHKRHLLFYSPKDHYYYVAIQNELTGKVITVLHLNYHKQLAWPITEQQCKAARQVYFDYISQLEHNANIAQNDSKNDQNSHARDANEKPQTNRKLKEITTFKRTYKVIVSALYICESGKPKRKTLFKLSVDYYINDFEKSIKQLLCSDAEITSRIDHHIRRKRLFHETIYSIVFENKKNHIESFTLSFRPSWIAQEYAEKLCKQRELMNIWLSNYEHKFLALPAPISIYLLRLTY